MGSLGRAVVGTDGVRTNMKKRLHFLLLVSCLMVYVKRHGEGGKEGDVQE